MKRPLLLLAFALLTAGMFAQKLPDVILYYSNGKYGLCDSTRKMIVQPVYDAISTMTNSSFYSVQNNGKWGVVDAKGTVIVPLQYEGVYFGDYEHIFFTNYKDKYGAVSIDGKVVIPCKYDQIYETMGNAIMAKSKKKNYLISMKTGAVLCTTKGDEWPSDLNGYLFSYSKKEKYGAVDVNGNDVIPFEYEYLSTSGPFITASMPDYTGYDIYDSLGHLFRSGVQSFNSECSDSDATVATIDGICNVWNSKGVQIFPLHDSASVDPYYMCEGDTLNYLTSTKSTMPSYGEDYGYNDYYYYDYNYSYGIVTRDGKELLPPVYSSAYAMAVGAKVMFYLETDSTIILKDEQLKNVLVLGKDSGYGIYEYHPDFMIMTKGEKYGVMDYHGHVIIPFRYNSLRYDEKYDRFYYMRFLGTGIMDGKGKELTKAIYSEVDDYTDSVSMVRDIYGQYWNLLDLKGRKLLPDTAYEALNYEYPFGYTYNGYDDGYYDEGYYGEDYYGGTNSADTNTHLSYYSVMKNDRYGILNSLGKVIIPDTCEGVYSFGRNGLFEILSHKQYAISDSTGKHVTRFYPMLEDAYSRDLIRCYNALSSAYSYYDDYGNYVNVPDTTEVLYGYISGNGKEIVPAKYHSEVTEYTYDDYGYSLPVTDSFLLMIRPDSIVDVYDLNGKMYGNLSGKYRNISMFDHIHPLFAVTDETGYKVGLVDANGKELLPMVYSSIYPFSADSSYIEAVDSLSVQHFFTLNGKTAPFLDAYAGASFESGNKGEIVVINNGKAGLITIGGKQLIPSQYDDLSPLAPGYYIFRLNGKSGIVTNSNRQVFGAEFEYISTDSDNGLYYVYMTPSDYDAGKGRLIDLKGTKYWSE